MRVQGLAIVLAVCAGAGAWAHAEESAGPAETYETVVTTRAGSELADPDLVLTGKELAERGVHDLAEALDLLPEISVHVTTRSGGFTADLQGARRDMILAIIDGVPVDDPFYGTFDLSAIPITEVIAVRVSLAPASPLDGPGGSGGVIEVTTRAATGPRRVAASAGADSARSGTADVSARTPVRGALAMRISASGESAARDLEVTLPDGSTVPFSATDRQAHGALRLDYLTERTRIVTDLWAIHRSLHVTAGAQSSGELQDIAPEDEARASVAAERQVGRWQLGGRIYGHVVKRLTNTYAELAGSTLIGQEDLLATNFGVSLSGDRKAGRHGLIALHGSVDNSYGDVTQGVAQPMSATGLFSFGELAGGFRLTERRYRLNADTGLALPLRGNGSPWPEAKVRLAVSPERALELDATVGHKGRVPTLRERIGTFMGSRDLGPEHSSFGELRAVLSPRSPIKLTGLGFVRYTQDLIHVAPATMKQVNGGSQTVRGVETTMELFPGRALSGGGTYTYLDYGPRTGPDAVTLDFFPRHRWEGWLTGHYHDRAGCFLRIRHASSETDGGDNTVEPSTTVDVSGWVRLSHRFTGTLRITNLLDAQVMQRAAVLAPGRTVAVSLSGVWD